MDESRRGAERAAEIVGALKAFARTPEERAPSTDARTDVAKAARAALRMVENDLRHRATLSVALSEVPPVRISETALVQVLVNLLINASHALPIGRRALGSVQLTTSAEDGRACVVVQDDGVGMSAETQRRVFDPFFTTKQPGEGTGLGLSITYRLVRDAGGDIEVASESGRGTTMTVWLPVAVAGAGEEAGAPHLRLEGLRLLIVDDDSLVGRGLRRRLRGCDVTLETSPRAALERAAAEPFDAILCDVMMPDMDGVAFHEALHARNPEAARRVVLMTGGGLADDVAALVERAGRPVLEKPFERDQLATALAELPPA
ncbi:MAG: ATP-binding protein [Myxococcota bacterium]